LITASRAVIVPASSPAITLETVRETTFGIGEGMQDNFFDENYRVGWDSGFGSRVSSTVTYRCIIESFVRLNDVHSVLDLGCGDWQFSKLIPWDNYGISYLGLDVSHVIIERNIANFGTERCQFQVIREPSEILGLGRFDLVICKDVLIHVPNSIANEYLDVFVAVGRHALVTVDAFPSYRINEDITFGDYRAMDIRKPPFSRSSTIIAEYVNFTGDIFWVKHVHLLTGYLG
jgi:SAM-dependent methyltransferase